MGAAYNQIVMQYVDANGKPATTFWTSVDQGTGGASAYTTLAAKAQAVSDAAITAVQFQTTVLLDGSAGDGPYNTVTDRCQILMRIPATGAPLTLGLVAPKSEIFLPDNVTLDLTNTDIIALEAAMMTLVGDKMGNAMGPIRRGYRTEAKVRI